MLAAGRHGSFAGFCHGQWHHCVVGNRWWRDGDHVFSDDGDRHVANGRLHDAVGSSSAGGTDCVDEFELNFKGNVDCLLQLPVRSCLSPAQGAESSVDGVVVHDDDKLQQVVSVESSVSAFLTSLQLEHLIELLEREQITMDILAEMGHEDLKQVGVSAYGFRHKILKGIATLRATTGTTRSLRPKSAFNTVPLMHRFRSGTDTEPGHTAG